MIAAIRFAQSVTSPYKSEIFRLDLYVNSISKLYSRKVEIANGHGLTSREERVLSLMFFDLKKYFFRNTAYCINNKFWSNNYSDKKCPTVP